MNLDDNLRDRILTHGPYEDTAAMSQALKMLMRRGKNWDQLPMDAKESLEHVCSLVARILTGDHCEPKHWHSAAGYLRLRGNALDTKLEIGISRLARRLRPVSPPEDGGAA